VNFVLRKKIERDLSYGHSCNADANAFSLRWVQGVKDQKFGLAKS